MSEDYSDSLKELFANRDKSEDKYPFFANTQMGKFWGLDGKLHREDGPAVELVDGTKEWWKNGVRYYPDKEIK